MIFNSIKSINEFDFFYKINMFLALVSILVISKLKAIQVISYKFKIVKIHQYFSPEPNLGKYLNLF